MTEEQEVQLEAATTAFRERDVSVRIQPSPAWWDLSPEDREHLFERQMEVRLVEAALDPDGLSSTARAVLGRFDDVSPLRSACWIR